MANPQPHFLLFTFPAQGHINPAIQLAKRLLRYGARVTLTTSLFAQRQMGSVAFPEGLTFSPFSDGYDDGVKPHDDHGLFMTTLKKRALQALHEIILRSQTQEGNHPVSYFIYSLLLPWAAEAARAHHLPWALLWIQPASVFYIYYHYFNGYGEVLDKCGNDESYAAQLPGLPPLTSCDLPTFIVKAQRFSPVLAVFKHHVEELAAEKNPKVLINTFDGLEPEALKALDKVELIGVGPLVPAAFLGPKDASDKMYGIDFFKNRNGEDYMDWLRAKPESSVVYVSFGSSLEFSKGQMEEMARGITESGYCFLWVVREEESEKELLGNDGFREELEKRGKIVSWCRQMEVLSEAAVGCFVTHCGWNSTVESLVCGVPVVAFPQFMDQGTNAKLIEDEWKVGVRVKAAEVVKGEEFRRCLDLVMGEGERGDEMRKNAKKWKDLAREAAAEGGSSDRNLKAFVNEVATNLF